MACFHKGVSAVVLASLLVACTEFVQQGTTPAQYAYDKGSCEKEALEKVPPNHQQQQNTRGSKSQAYTIDANDPRRTQWHDACMQIRGYSKHIRFPWSIAAAAPSNKNEQRYTGMRQQ